MTKLLKKQPTGTCIEIAITTWNKDSHGLYDYDGVEENYKKQTIFFKNSVKIYRDNMKGQNFYDTNNKSNDNFSNVCEVIIDKSKSPHEFKLKPIAKKENQTQEDLTQQKNSYVAVRDLSNKSGTINGYALKPGNIIKLGRVEYIVIETKNEEETFTLRSTNHFQDTTGIFEIEKNKIDKDSLEEGEKNCKVCLCNQQSPGDPLISPCKCRGSCMLIHVGCLRTWINSKVKKQIKGIALSYNFTKFECEICKYPFPQIVRFESRDVEMMTIEKPKKPYIILESICNKLQNKEERCLHLISAAENTPIKIGRGHECQIRITDISVSRKHAEIIFKEGEFYITDTKAKFGTLIKFEDELPFYGAKPIKIQFGRTLFEFKPHSEHLEDIVDTE